MTVDQLEGAYVVDRVNPGGPAVPLREKAELNFPLVETINPPDARVPSPGRGAAKAQA